MTCLLHGTGSQVWKHCFRPWKLLNLCDVGALMSTSLWADLHSALCFRWASRVTHENEARRRNSRRCAAVRSSDADMCTSCRLCDCMWRAGLSDFYFSHLKNNCIIKDTNFDVTTQTNLNKQHLVFLLCARKHALSIIIIMYYWWTSILGLVCMCVMEDE